MIIDKYIDVWSRRHLINYLVKSSIQTKFYKNLLGKLWNALIPLSQIGMYYFLLAVVFSGGSLRSGTSFIIITMGIMHYSFLLQVSSHLQNCIINNTSLLLQVKLEPIILLVAGYIQAVKLTLFGVVLFFIFYFLFGNEISIRLLAYPVILVCWLALCWVIGLFISIVSVFFRDMLSLFPIFLQVLMYTSPVIYSYQLFQSISQSYVDVLTWNPITSVFILFQWSLFGLEVDIFKPFTIVLIWIIAGLFISHAIYSWGRPRITKVL